MKNLFLKCLVFLFRLLIKSHPPQNRILIIATTALGDTLWATPAIENIRRTFPNAYLAVLTSPIGLEILKHNPHIHRLFLWRRPLYLFKQLYRERFDTILLFHASQRLALPLAACLGASRIIGTLGLNKGLDSLLTHPLPNAHKHEIVRRLEIAAAAGAKPYTETLSFFLTPEEKLPPRPGIWIALHPGSKDPFKRWPASHFIALGKRLKEELDCNILITGTESTLMHQVAAHIPGAHIDDPKRPLRPFAALLEQIDLLIVNDTGPFHLACALNRPVIGLFSSTDPALCGPHKASSATVLARRPSCSPCLKRKCPLPFCLLQIGVEEVVKKSTYLVKQLSLSQY